MQEGRIDKAGGAAGMVEIKASLMTVRVGTVVLCFTFNVARNRMRTPKAQVDFVEVSMFADIPAALTAIKTASDLTALVLKSKVDAAVRDKAIELTTQIVSLQSLIFEMQAKHHALLEENNQLKQENARLKKWEAEAERYDLKEIDRGVFVRVLKPDASAGEPVHWICPNCYEDRRKSILQLSGRGQITNMYLCSHCGAKFFDTHGPHSPPARTSLY